MDSYHIDLSLNWYDRQLYKENTPSVMGSISG